MKVFVPFRKVDGGRVMVDPESIVRIDEGPAATAGGPVTYLSVRHAGVVRVDHTIDDVAARLVAAAALRPEGTSK